MKTKSKLRTNLKLKEMLLAGAVAGALPLAQAQEVVSTGHVDVGIGYMTVPGEWDLHVHDETNEEEFEPDDVVLRVNAEAQTEITGQISFLGNVGDPVWILPATHNPSLLFLGIAAEEVDSGVFVGNQVTLSLRPELSDGPGHFAFFQADSFGNPEVIMDTRGGAPNLITLTVGGHAHGNWAFSAPGTYELAFEASGTLVEGSVFTSSGPVHYVFEVVPEPGTFALLGIGALGFLMFYRRRH